MIIDQLPTISNVQNSDELPIERGQTTYKTTVGKVVGAVSKIVADEYDNTSTYAVGDYCVYEGTLYVCNTAISTAEEWNASHWTATNVTDEIPSAYNSNPEMDGTASPGSSTAWAKGDHVHPHDTSRATVANYTSTLAAASWSGASAPYSQALTVNGLLASDTPTVDVVMSGTYSTDEARKTAWAAIYRAVSSANTLTVYASELPTVDLPIQLQCVR